MSGEVDFKRVKSFLETGWIEGWGLSYYQNSHGKSRLGRLVYEAKYGFGRYSLEERSQTAEELRSVVKDFIHKQYPSATRPFNTVITPPGNLEKPFDLTKYIAERLISGGIRDFSGLMYKKREIPSMKHLNVHERKAMLKGAFGLREAPTDWNVKGFLILDDILDTGATAHEVCDTLENYFPGIPRYYLAITYLGDGK